MKLTVKNKNYCATVVKIDKLISLDNCDNVVHANIFGNLVIVSKDTKIGDTGLFFPVETQLSHDYCHNNNLYRHKELNKDETKTGYFEDTRRIKAVNFRGHASMGLFMPLESLAYISHNSNADEFSGIHLLKIGDEFDTINKFDICNKYVVKERGSGLGNVRKSKQPKESCLIENQFRLHYDTAQLGRNIDQIKPGDVISITKKMHGTSGVSSKILTKRKLSFLERLVKVFGVKVTDETYRNIYSSRKVIKNDYLNKNPNGYYDTDIWGLANESLRNYIKDGMTLYYEIVGYLPTGAGIQGNYDYGMSKNEYGIFIYRITYTSSSGSVYEFSAKQVQDWCKSNGLNAVPEIFYGKAKELLIDDKRTIEAWQGEFLEVLQNKYLEKDCDMCKNKLPDEGIVLRIEDDSPAFKLKSFRFLEKETKDLNKGNTNIEDEQN